MINKKGFVFVETIITIVVLTTTLVLLYVSYAGSLTREKTRLYYDDIAYVYKTLMVKYVLDDTLNVDSFKNKVDNSDMYLYIFREKSDIYKNNSDITSLVNLYNIKELIYIKYSNLKELKTCLKNNNSDDKCKNSINNINAYGEVEFKDYLLRLDVEKPSKNEKSIIGEEDKGILIALFYEAKDGTIMASDYRSCLECLVFSNTDKEGFDKSIYQCNDKKNLTIVNTKGYSDEGINVIRSNENDVLKDYYKSGKSYNMACENAYYIAWVYL